MVKEQTKARFGHPFYRTIQYWYCQYPNAETSNSLIIDVEVAMLSKNSKAVKQHQKEILGKSGNM